MPGSLTAVRRSLRGRAPRLRLTRRAAVVVGGGGVFVATVVDLVPAYTMDDAAARALTLWQRAAAQGNTAAKLKLGDYHYDGRGVAAPNRALAAQYYQLADSDRSAQAAFNLGFMYEDGIGVQQVCEPPYPRRAPGASDTGTDVGTVAVGGWPQDFHLAKRYYDRAIEVAPTEAFLPASLALTKLFARMAMQALWQWVTGAPTAPSADDASGLGDSGTLEPPPTVVAMPPAAGGVPPRGRPASSAGGPAGLGGAGRRSPVPWAHIDMELFVIVVVSVACMVLVLVRLLPHLRRHHRAGADGRNARAAAAAPAPVNPVDSYGLVRPPALAADGSPPASRLRARAWPPTPSPPPGAVAATTAAATGMHDAAISTAVAAASPTTLRPRTVRPALDALREPRAVPVPAAAAATTTTTTAAAAAAAGTQDEDASGDEA
jgi:hypothetical protein